MPQSKILVDTNAYLRLAKTIRPLLFMPFGDNEYCLYILPELNQELASYKLRSKFHWVTEEEFAENRQHFPSLGKKQKKAIDTTFEYLWDHVQTELPGPSKVDALYIAYAIELGIPVVTDDQDMIALAETFDAKVMPTLELLKIMLDCGHTDMATINGLCDYWRYISDLPANFHRDFKRLFPGQ
ncbi:MAG TPA: PIN domain-containing protein [Candidatus Thiothrix moscowensis]|uniref:PIN domain-containing protein n=1 Tax=unclassified Thiothrix TaxID=2636184 RepID=UPI0025E16390|nr:MULTISPECIES: PIN domain-containing protein [unclassified Thiothrix]HRJ51574.1 PIN domain-containing protein [Candidatus Thiothrix moscowensis]HRJ91889.1 PIN domain-containing protein [Candidatus Thiothrix moscowensis]